MIKISSPGQSLVPALDHAHVLLYFDILTRKTTELDFDVFIPNVDLSLSFKMIKDHLNPIIEVQDIAEIKRCVKIIFTCISSFECFALHVFLNPLPITNYHPIVFSIHAI